MAVVTDGCNWGDRPKDASWIANKAFAEFMVFFLILLLSVDKKI